MYLPTKSNIMMAHSHKDKVIALAQERGVLRPRDLDAIGVPRVYLKRLCDDKVLTRVGRGLYVSTDSEPTENASLAETFRRVPHGIVCLLSALRFHRLTTQAPFEVWLAIDYKARLPKVDYPALRIVRFSGKALTFGVEEHTIENVPVRVYSPAKTVADCFKYRNKIGLDVAVEALRDCWTQKKATMDELWEAAKVCRMSNVMRPYMESLT